MPDPISNFISTAIDSAPGILRNSIKVVNERLNKIQEMLPGQVGKSSVTTSLPITAGKVEKGIPTPKTAVDAKPETKKTEFSASVMLKEGLKQASAKASSLFFTFSTVLTSVKNKIMDQVGINYKRDNVQLNPAQKEQFILETYSHLSSMTFKLRDGLLQSEVADVLKKLNEIDKNLKAVADPQSVQYNSTKNLLDNLLKDPQLNSSISNPIVETPKPNTTDEDIGKLSKKLVELGTSAGHLLKLDASPKNFEKADKILKELEALHKDLNRISPTTPEQKNDIKRLGAELKFAMDIARSVSSESAPPGWG